MTDGTAKWLDPDDGITAIPASAAISLDAIETFTTKLLGDVLVAQRLIPDEQTSVAPNICYTESGSGGRRWDETNACAGFAVC